MEEVIEAVAEAIWPATSPDATPGDHPSYSTISGADCKQVPGEVIHMINTCFPPDTKQQLKLVLRLMSHRLPMLLLAGRHSLTGQWPFVQSFPEMPLGSRQAVLAAWCHSALPVLRKAYKGLKSLVASALLSHIDPATGTNPFFEAMDYTPGDKVVEARLGPEPPGAAEAEEVLDSATIHLPAVAARDVDVKAYLTKRGFATSPYTAAPLHTDARNTPDQQKLRNGTAAGSGSASACSSSSSSSSSFPASDVELFYDALIVGSGAGGGVTAALLAAAGLRVLVLEKSSWVRSKDMSWLEGKSHVEMYERAGFLSTADGNISILAGSTLGGGTKVNWTASLKTPDHVRREWAAAPHNLDVLGPDSQAFTNSLEAVCTRLGVSTGTSMSGPNAKLLQGLKQLGMHGEELPRNCLSKTCSAYCNFGCRSGHKQSSDVCWLADAVRAGAQVLTGVEAQHIVTERQQVSINGSPVTRSRKVVGLLALTSRHTTPGSATADAKQLRLLVRAPLVVACAGSIHTPALLLRSGVRVGGNVGSHLRLHPAAGLVGFFQPTPEQAAAKQGAVDMHKGVSMGSFSRAAAAWSAGGYGAMVSVPAVHPGLLAALSPDHRPGYLKQLMLELNNISACVIFTRDSSSGRVGIDRQGQPVVDYYPCGTTQAHLLDGIELAVRALVAAGAVRVLVPNAAEEWDLSLNSSDTPEARTAQLEAFVARMRGVGVGRKYTVPLLSAHQMGSCRMGSSAQTSVCDASGQCWEVSGLYVADGSVFPTASGVNPMITIYSLAHMVSSGIAQQWKAAAKKVNAASLQ